MEKRRITLDRSAPTLKLALAFGLLVSAMIGVAALGIAHSYRDQFETREVQDESNDERTARDVLLYSNINARLLLQAFTAKRTSELDELLARRAENSQKISSLIDQMAGSTEAPREGERVENIKQLRAKYQAAYENALTVLREQNQPEQARTLMIESALPALTEYHDALHEYIAFQKQRIHEIQTTHDARTGATRRETFWLTGLVVVIAGALAIFVLTNVSRHIARRRRVEEVLKKTHEELEDIVRARTAQLLLANGQLQDEMATRQTVQEELRASEDRYRKIVETAEDMIYRLTPDGRVTFANAAAARTVGRSAEECRGMHFLSLTRKDFRNEALDFYRRQIGNGIPVTYLELPLATADGRELWIGQNVQLIVENDQLVEVQAVSRDVTRRKLVERQLLESERRYRVLFESNPQPMWVFDTNTLAFLAVNDAAIEQYGYSREEFLGMTIESIRPPDDVSALFTRKANVHGGLGMYDPDCNWRHQRKDGTLIDVEITWHLIDFDGRAAKLVLATDITKRKRAEVALRASERRFRDVFTFAPEGIYQSSRAGAIIAANKKLAHLLGYESVEELLEINLERDVYLAPSDHERLISTYEQGRCAGDFEIQWKRKDGSLVWVALTAHLVKSQDGAQEYSEGFVHDISTRKRMEEERQVISEIIQGVNNTSDLNELLQLIQRSISKCLYAENCFVALYDEVHGELSFPFWVDKFDPCPAPQPLGMSFSSHVLKTGRPIIVDPKLTEEMYQRGEVEKSGSDSNSWLGVPLNTPARTIGVLVVQHYEEENAYDQRDLEFLSSVGSQVALAIERKRAEQALQESEDRYHRLIELSPDGIIVHHEGNISFVNSAGVKLVGARNESQLIGKSVFDLALPEYREMLAKRVDQMSYGDPLPLAEVRGRRFDGVEIDCEISSVPFIYHDRLATLAVIRDITERKRAEQALKEANERALIDYERLVERIAALGQTLGNARNLDLIFRALREFAIASVPCDGLVISLYEPDKGTRRVTYCWADDREYDPHDVPEIPVGTGVTGRAMKSGVVTIANDYHHDLRVARARVGFGDVDPDTPRSALIAPMTVMGRTVGCVELQTLQAGSYQQAHATAMRMAANLAASAIENVTLIEREQAKEEQLRQALKMEAVGRLAGGVAHDFNNMLTAINGYSDLTLMSLDPGSPLAPKIQEIRKAGERAATLTRQLLAFSRKQMMQPRVIDLNSIIAEVGTMLLRMIGEDVSVQTVLQPGLGQVKADPGQIEQVLMNLAVNARDAMPTGGNVTIETRNDYVERALIKGQETVRPGHYVVLSVSDDGCGMDAVTEERIFEPFFTTKGFGKGTGLGLSTVYGIIKQSEGNIWVDSEPEKGTTFKIYLPRVDELSRSDEALEEAQAVQLGSETVLLVEDEQMVRDLSREVLEQYGYTVICASDGQDGLRACKEFAGKIDLMITDVVMPRMSGRELAEHLAILRPDTKVLYMSGFTDDAIVRHGLLEEHFAFIQKPFSPELLAQTARQLLDSRAA